MTEPQHVILYGYGIFGANNTMPISDQVNAVRMSDFTDLVLWTLHVAADGTLTYNNTTIVSADGTFSSEFSYLADAIIGVKANATAIVPYVQRVLFGIGEDHDAQSPTPGDYKNIRSLLQTEDGTQTLKRNFAALEANVPFDGYDFDDEDLYDVDTIARLTAMLASESKIITYCPFEQESFWVNCLERVYQENGRQLVAWWNLQVYGIGADPGTWARAIDPTTTGVADPAAFVVPGYEANDGTSTITQTFKDLLQSDPGIAGGFIWNSKQIFAMNQRLSDYASAIRSGLAG
jgi:hypothetical protein